VYITSGLTGIVSTTPFQLGLYVLPKRDLIGVTPTAVRMSRFLTAYPPAATDFYYGADPQIDYLGTAMDGLHIAGYRQPTAVFTGSGYRWAVDAVYERMTGQESGAATLLPWAITPFYQFDSTLNPPPQSLPADYGRQPGTSVRLNNGGGTSNIRVGDAVYSVAAAPVLGRLGILWRRFQPSTNTIVDAGFIGDAVNDYLSASIAANASGAAVIAYARTGPTSYASFYCSVGQPDASGKLVFGPPTLVKAGSDIYDENGPVKSPGVARFVDYASSVSVHPLDASHFWISGPYVSGRNIGSTWIAEVVVPSLSISDADASEGALAQFTVTLAPASAQTVTVDFATANGTATAPADYLAATGTLTFAPGETTKQVSVTVNSDVSDEPDETFVVNLTNPTNAVLADGQGLGTIHQPVQFFSSSPCRILDTRDPNGPLGGPILSPGQQRAFTVTGGPCAVPTTAKALSANLTVVGPTSAGFVTVFPGDGSLPSTSSINFSAGQTRANNGVFRLAGDGSGRLNIANRSSGSTHVVLDVSGYFE
jgi:hypothetical protein